MFMFFPLLLLTFVQHLILETTMRSSLFAIQVIIIDGHYVQLVMGTPWLFHIFPDDCPLTEGRSKGITHSWGIPAAP
jgi:hypothetical protein